MPYEVADLKLATQQSNQEIELSGQIVPADADVDRITHVIHVEITDPTGRLRREYTRNILARQGRFKERFFVGYNAAAGQWTISARDTATGVTRLVTAER